MVTSPLQAKLDAIQADIQTRQPEGEATLIAVTKYASLDQMRTLFQMGLRHFGENKVQDALLKKEALSDIAPQVTWHLIGHLQRNKVNKAVGHFDWIHSVDSLPLAQKISQRAAELDITQCVLLQVNISGEESKEGFTAESLEASLEELWALPNLMIGGLMTMAPAQADSDTLQSVFAGLATLRQDCRNKLRAFSPLTSERVESFKELSMGMSQDYSAALSYGATMIRIGQALIQLA